MVCDNPRFVELWCSAQFLISAEYHDGLPFLMADYFIGFHTHQRIGTHPFNFLSNSCEAVDEIFVVCEGEWGDVGLRSLCARDSADGCILQKRIDRCVRHWSMEFSL